VARTVGSAARQGEVRLTVSLSSAARRQLATRHSVRLALSVTFSGGAGVKTITLVVSKPRKRG
jgi:hypothetical protein